MTKYSKVSCLSHFHHGLDKVESVRMFSFQTSSTMAFSLINFKFHNCSEVILNDFDFVFIFPGEGSILFSSESTLASAGIYVIWINTS